ncbi:MAG: 23S rRNA (cytidine(2498)-2'-O)-methyltransferase RlmM, partial [Gammaproteobacteria bacterium]|nr:23S rRNA (cytidine(2498)-2'-O)-methyltransferase RlmM [Gammaproteobacteria bacterium]
FARAKPQSGLAVFETAEEQRGSAEFHQLAAQDFTFARQWFFVLELLKDLRPTDRVEPIAHALGAAPESFGELFLETPDTNLGKELSPLCRALDKPLNSHLQHAGLWNERAALRAHVCFIASTSAYVGYARRDQGSPWVGGIPRLKFPRGAPSRSTLKLDEALLHFLSSDQQQKWLQPGMTVVDLGAAPGGWTFQFVRRHMRVTAVDNGAIDAALLASAIVEHVRADGFRYQPVKRVDWMVCDMVEQPMRIAQLAARWLSQGWCQRSIFNLKLPMKKRYEETQRCLDVVRSTLDEAGVRYELASKQLYHDREEVTVFVARK